ncbi:MAG: DUF6147 family protein [Bacillota bacterium]|nr:DUF6147 family protein [Bacillota bacterium]
MRWVTLLITLMLTLCFVSPAWAVPKAPPISDPGGVGILSTRYLVDAVARLYNNYDGTVTLYGKSVANQTVDQIWVKVTLQRWDGSKWVDVNTGYRLDKYNAHTVQISKDQTIQRGNYYRCKGEHQVIHDGCYDPNPQVVQYTDAMLID